MKREISTWRRAVREFLRGMLAASVLLALMAGAVALDRSWRRDDAAQLMLVSQMPDGDPAVILHRDRFDHYVGHGLINGTRVQFVLDTGASTVSVSRALARQLGLAQGAPVNTGTANGTITTYRTTLDRVELGGIVRRDVAASINPHMDGREVLLGMSFLRNLDFRQHGDVLLVHDTTPRNH
ncbi:MAG: TIGR02281 family clan AA aspartic protease [Gammaproteobacteria bacterium]|jgi:aspartyl protease family protein